MGKSVAGWHGEVLKKKRQLVGIACAHSETEGKPMMRCLLMERFKEKEATMGVACAHSGTEGKPMMSNAF